jgi:hypothetical protein
VHDPYFRYFTGEKFFQNKLPHERSGLSHWRKRIGDRINTAMSAVGYNQRLIFVWPRTFLRKITAAILLAMAPPPNAQGGFLTADYRCRATLRFDACLKMAGETRPASD